MALIKLMFRLRNKLYLLLARISLGDMSAKLFVGGFTKLSKSTKLGVNTNFNGFKVLGKGDVTIGDNFHSGVECMLITENHDFEGTKLPYDDNIIRKKILIEDNVWFGNRVLVLGGVTIGEGAIVQAGSVVVSNIPPLSICGGSPAKVFKMRDEAHYINLKNKRAFH